LVGGLARISPIRHPFEPPGVRNPWPGAAAWPQNQTVPKSLGHDMKFGNCTMFA